jgi:rare lipoprotein A
MSKASLFRSAVRPTLYATALLLVACSSSPDQNSNHSGGASYPEPNKGRYAQQKDSIPLRFPTEEEMRDPEPTIEPLSRGGNKPYNIYGIDYTPTTSITEYSETGTASWYGSKFHGHDTSNGEKYDVFAMTAAHKTLPLPSYVRVTNLDNYRSAIVRVNDRGPFHDGRIIDLSYSAAYKLGIFQTGTGRVKVELVTAPAMQGQSSFATPISRNDFSAQEQPKDYLTEAEPVRSVAPVSGKAASGCYIQLLASGDQAKVQRLGNELQQQWSLATTIETANGFYRLIAGPIHQDAAGWLQKLQDHSYPDAYITNKKLCGL